MKVTTAVVPSQPKSKLVQVKQFINTKSTQLGTAIGLAMLAGSASANTPTAPDLNPIVDMIYSIMTIVSSIGMAVLSVYATAKVFKWVKSAF